MNQDKQKIKYFLYARKSSESEDRQVQSVDDQVNRLKQLAKDLDLHIVKIYTEAKSAKKPNNRPVFDEVLDRIKRSEADGILCWQINRLSRNPIDSGNISWMLQQGVLKSIRTIDREYVPEDNVLIFSVESGVANQFILDLSKNTKRGMQSKFEKGWLPSVPPLGYLNDTIKHTIIKDTERFNLVRKMWDTMLTGSYTPPKILEIATKEWGFRTRPNRKSSDNIFSLSGIYKLFTNLFYTGILVRKDGMQYQGRHESMITLEEYDRVQMLLGREGRPRPQTRKFTFTGSIRCGECGCLYTAEQHTKIIKETGKLKTFIYYHCTKKKKDFRCPQIKNIPADDLASQIKQEIDKYTILPKFLEWALECLNSKNDTEIEDRTKIYEAQHRALTETQGDLDELTKMRYRKLIDDEAYLKEKSELQVKISDMKRKLRETESRADKWLELTEKTFNFATYARATFLKAKTDGRLELQKEILLALGKTPIIQGEKLFIEPNEWLVPIKNEYPALEQEYKRLELEKTLTKQAKMDAFASIRARWGA